MRIPEGVVRMIYEKVEEHWREQNKLKFRSVISELHDECDMYQKGLEEFYDVWHESEVPDVLEGHVPFVDFFRRSHWPGFKVPS